MLYLYRCFLGFPKGFCRKTYIFAYKISSTMVKAILLSLVMTWSLCVSAQIDENLQTQLNILRDSCAATYNQKELLPFIEKYKGKEVWLVGNLHNAARYWKMNDSVNKHQIWLTESRNMWGTAKQSLESGFLGSFNSITGVKCQCQGVVLLPNLGNRTRWTPQKIYYGDGVNLGIDHLRYQDEYQRDVLIRIHGNQFKGQWIENAQNPRKGPIQLLYKYYVVFTICPNLTYKCKGSLFDNPMTADTLFVDYNKELYKLILLEDDFQQKFKQHENWEKAQWEKYNRMEAARYRYAIQQWGEKAADKIQHGLLEFGFSPEMCVQARREEPYRIDKAMTPFGMATRYDFYQSNLKLYFIDNQLIGIQTKEQSPLYYM